MHVVSTRAVLLFRISYIYGSHHTITSMLKYIHSSAQTCGRVGRQRYCLGRFGGHPPAPPSSYALRRRFTPAALHAQTNYHIHGRRGTTPTLESAGVGGCLALRDEDLIMVSVRFRRRLSLRLLRPRTSFFRLFYCYCLSL